jgi:hypothetical protein
MEAIKNIIFSFSFSAAVNAETREEVAIKKVGNAFDNKFLTYSDRQNCH